MKSVSFVFGLFVFFTSIILSMAWIIQFQYHSDQFLIHAKQLHRTLSMSCLDYSCSADQIQKRIKDETLDRWPNHSTIKSNVTTLLFDPLVLEIEIELSIPIGLEEFTLKYSKIMIEERK